MSRRTQATRTTNYTYNAANQLTAAGCTSYSYDANGNMTGNSVGLSLSYNAADQTTSIDPAGTVGAVSMAYADRTQDERISKGATAFQNNLLGVGKEGSNTYYRWADDFTASFALVSERIGTNRYYYLFDGLGSVVGLIDSSCAVVNTYKYDPYGRKVSATGTVANPWRYAGAYLDTETGMYKMGTRYYDPSIQRFTQMDSNMGQVQNPVSLNRYVYAGNDPCNSVDPTGRITTAEWRCFLTGLAALVSFISLLKDIAEMAASVRFPPAFFLASAAAVLDAATFSVMWGYFTTYCM